MYSGCGCSQISPCAAIFFCSKNVTSRQLKAYFNGFRIFPLPSEICAKNMMVSLKCRWYPSGRTDTKRNIVTEVTLSSENMKLSYFQKILFYEPRPKGRTFLWARKTVGGDAHIAPEVRPYGSVTHSPDPRHQRRTDAFIGLCRKGV